MSSSTIVTLLNFLPSDLLVSAIIAPNVDPMQCNHGDVDVVREDFKNGVQRPLGYITVWSLGLAFICPSKFYTVSPHTYENATSV